MKIISGINLLLLGCVIATPLRGQVNFLGKPGFMTTPSASWEEERHLGVSFAYLPNNYSVFDTPKEDNATHFYNLRLTLVSFMEVGFSVAHRPEMADKIGVGDRQLDFRFRLLREREYLPAIVLGWTPPGSASPVFSHDYLVATKNIPSGIGNFRLTGGYGSPFVIRKDKDEDNLLKALELRRKSEFPYKDYLTGFFGSLAYMPVDFGGLAVEYNTESMNAGIFIELWQQLQLQAWTFEGRDWAFQVEGQFPLDFLPRALRRHEKSLD